jgi:ubiquinone/menaquinone biosynthesis C-methylase UbiE
MMNDMRPDKDHKLSGGQQVCPWWLCFTFDNVFRRLFQNPDRILRSYIKPGWTVLDVGPGMGYFTVPLAKLVGDSGKVIAADLQPKMLDGVYRRSLRLGLQDRIKLHQSTSDKIGIIEPIDFCLAFWMVHEVPDKPRFISEISSQLKPGGLFLLVEPRFHVSRKDYFETLRIAKGEGLSMAEQPRIFLSNAALFEKRSVVSK